jgi:effector-binding domain-containing protein
MNETQVVLEERVPQSTLSIRQTVPLNELQQAQGESLGALWSYIQRRGVRPAGQPFVRYHTFGAETTDVEVGIPVTGPASGSGRIAGGELPGGPALATSHIGSHDTLADAYRRLQVGLEEHGRDAAGAGWEVYEWIDPAVEPNPASWPAPSRWRTRLIQPIK